MKLLPNVFSPIFLICSITAFPVEEENESGDDAAELLRLRPASYEISRNGMNDNNLAASKDAQNELKSKPTSQKKKIRSFISGSSSSSSGEKRAQRPRRHQRKDKQLYRIKSFAEQKHSQQHEPVLPEPEPRGTSRRGDVADGDVMNPNDLLRNGLADKSLYWPEGIIPCIILNGFTSREVVMLMKAVHTIEQWTCVRFVQHTNETDYVRMMHVDGAGCFSSVGREGGAQDLVLEGGACFDSVGVAIHELLHTVGIIHEHARPDRDQYIEINQNNIEAAAKRDYEKYPDDGSTKDFGVPYDYNSIMHYNPYRGSLWGGPTLEARLDAGAGDSIAIGQHFGLTARDAIKIRNMYNCHYYTNETEHSSRVLPNVNVIADRKPELWNTYFNNFNFEHSTTTRAARKRP